MDHVGLPAGGPVHEYPTIQGERHFAGGRITAIGKDKSIPRQIRQFAVIHLNRQPKRSA